MAHLSTGSDAFQSWSDPRRTLQFSVPTLHPQSLSATMPPRSFKWFSYTKKTPNAVSLAASGAVNSLNAQMSEDVVVHKSSRTALTSTRRYKASTRTLEEFQHMRNTHFKRRNLPMYTHLCVYGCSISTIWQYITLYRGAVLKVLRRKKKDTSSGSRTSEIRRMLGKHWKAASSASSGRLQTNYGQIKQVPQREIAESDPGVSSERIMS